MQFVSQFLDPYLLGRRYSAADAYLHMLASWYPGDRAELHERLPALGAHAQKLAERRAIRTVEADHASAG